MTIREQNKVAVSTLMPSILLAIICTHAAVTSAQQTQPASSTTAAAPIPVSVPHLYWHFLIYVSVLDSTAANMTAQGQDGSWLRNDLQTRLQFSDADFAPIRASSQRLASNLAPISQQMNSLKSASPTTSTVSQVQALVAQREAAINSEISSLSQALSPEKQATLEAFMMQFFAPKSLSYTTSATPASN